MSLRSVAHMLIDAPVDGSLYARQSGAWIVVPSSTGGLPEAPTGGQVYGRQGSTTSWLPVLPTSGGTVTGATTFSGTGTALTVTNATQLGTLTVGGAATFTSGPVSLPANSTGPWLPTAGGTVTGALTLSGTTTASAPLIWTATHSTTPRAAQDRSADVINVLDYVATGATDYAPGIQAALNAVPAAGATVLVPVMCPVGSTLLVPSNTLLRGCGPGTGFVCLAAFTGSDILANQNNTATTLTDHDISIEDMTIDYGPLTGGGAHHVIGMQCVSNVRITNCTLQVRTNGDAVALRGCYNSHIHGCSAFDFINCAYDHWVAPTYARVTNCFAQSAHSAQFVNFNPDPLAGGASSNVARGFVMSDCELVCTDTSANPCQIEPLYSGASVLDVVITGNIFRNVVLALRGNTRGVVISGNQFDAPLGGSETIKSYTLNGGTPTDFVVCNNHVMDAATSSSNVGVIRIEATNATIVGNRVSGDLYNCAGIYAPSGSAIVVGNSVSNLSYNTGGAFNNEVAFKVPRINALPTTSLNIGSGAVAQFGDATAANSDSVMVSYITGTAGGAASLLGINTYYDTTAALQRFNTARNGWYLYHDNRSQTGTDGNLRLGVVSSAGVNSTAVTYGIDGSMTGPSLNLSTPAANLAQLSYQAGSTLSWRLIRDNTATAGNNSGLYLSAYSYTDAGAYQGTLFTAARASGGTGAGAPYWLNFSPRILGQTRATKPNGVYGDEDVTSITDQQPTTTLGANPITTTNGSATVTITWNGATASGGPLDTSTGEAWVNIAGATAFNGVSLAGWYKVQTITAPNTFTVTYGSPATGTGTGGGSACTVRPSFSAAFNKRYTAARTGACGYSIQSSHSFSAWPEFYQTSSTGIIPDYEQWYSEFFTPPDATGSYVYHSIQWESDLINRGKDNGYSPNLFGSNNSTVGIWFQPVASLLGRTSEGGTPANWNTTIAFAPNANTATNLRVGFYNLINGLPNSVVGNGNDPTGHGGVSIDLFGAYEYLPLNPFATAVGTGTITVTLVGFGAAGLVNGDSVYIPLSYSSSGVTFGAGSYTIANVNVAVGTFTITGTGTATATGSFGGSGASLYFAKRSPWAPLQFTGQFRHGLYTAPDSYFEDGLVVHARAGQGIGWDDGTGVASVNSSATSAGNINVIVAPAGTGAFYVAGAGQCSITSGAAAPAATQPAGSIYMRTGGASGARLYVSAGGGTWTAIAAV